MKRIRKFVQMWNEGMIIDKPSPSAIRHVSKELLNAYNRQYTAQPSTRGRVGVSQLGKPAVLTALAHLGLYNAAAEDEDRAVSFSATGKQQWTFFMGDIFEVIATSCYERFAHGKIEDAQLEVDFHGVKGHIDGIAEGRVLEFKTINGYDFERFVNDPLSDLNGYATQLSVYCYMLEMPGVWIVLNKFNGALTYVPLDRPDDFCVRRAKKIVRTLPKIKTRDDVLKHFAPPEPTWNDRTNKFEIPREMRWIPEELKKWFYPKLL